MPSALHIYSEPKPGQKLLRFLGDTVTFSLDLSRPERGRAFVRTNLGQARIARSETIRNVHEDTPGLGRDWFDIPMSGVTPQRFRLRLPLTETGHFEAKAMFIPEGQKNPVWIPGPNVVINVAPADTCCGNIIYNAFVRQFGPNKQGGFYDTEDLNKVASLDRERYTVIPPSGTFRKLMEALDFIIGRLGCRFIQLLPIHPTPTTYGRMGRFGSPYAALSFTAIDPSLADFDDKATPLEQFIELVDAIHARNAKVLLDIAINHTGWAASIHETHPYWLVRSPAGHIEVPGAWGVRWEDLTKLDYRHKDLWQYMADVFLTWCNRGVDGFRCDAGYMIPVPVWQYLIAAVREQFPDTLFFLEGLGGKLSTTHDLLNLANFNWAYSELFQNYDRREIETYLSVAIDISEGEGVMAHYAETHDNPRLASRSQIWAKMRTALCALSSFQGAFGFANGVEWFATEKINVHESPSLNWHSEENQVDHIRRLSILMKNHPAFHDKTRVTLVDHDSENSIMLHRHHGPTDKRLLVIANLDDNQSDSVSWPQATNFELDQSWHDLLTGEKVNPANTERKYRLDLSPGQVLCLTNDPDDLPLIQDEPTNDFQLPDRILHQRLRGKALAVYKIFHGFTNLGEWDIEAAVRRLEDNPVQFCRRENTMSGESRVIRWVWPKDIRRTVMLPPDHFLFVESPDPFCVKVSHGRKNYAVESSLPSKEGRHWVLLMPFAVPDRHQALNLHISVFSSNSCERADARLLLLSDRSTGMRACYARHAIKENGLRALVTNERGATCYMPVEWGKLLSRYDAVLSANIDSDVPEERWIMLTRCRVWVVCQDYSQALDGSCLERYVVDESLRGTWTFHVPTGRGTHVVIHIKIELDKKNNEIQVVIHREISDHEQGRLPDGESVEMIVRPDIENRSFHGITKAYEGPEHQWPDAVAVYDDGFTFQPDDIHILEVKQPRCKFVHEPEWHYMVHRPEDESRGFDPNGDLFSPGYFRTRIKGGETTILNARIEEASERKKRRRKQRGSSSAIPLPGTSQESAMGVHSVLETGFRSFIVRRNSLKTVIAGYPWFLDWGRDAIIAVRALIEMRDMASARSILKLFGWFEENGTLPNMLQGSSTGNRETSDAPLWFVIACSDLVEKEKRQTWLKERCGDRTVAEVIRSIVVAYINGTPNGIRMDKESGLVFSPSHYTWMDTNHPAGSPRIGYPIEIQALWYRALRFISMIDTGNDQWTRLADSVQDAIGRYFWLDSQNYLSDCLHAEQGERAKDADPDDALRPNQLLAVTMGAVKSSTMMRSVVETCQELLVPGAIRSLSDRPLRRFLEIKYHGRHLCDPHRPYKGRYEGDEDTARKPSYHNGTAWTWLFPSFCEAWVMAFGRPAHKTARAWMCSMTNLLNEGCIGYIPEILDGDAPHRQRGCSAQAWGVSEALRVWLKFFT